MQRVDPFRYVRLLTAAETARLRRQEGPPLERNARLLTLALCRKSGRPVFSSPAALIRRLTRRQIERYALAWLSYSRRVNPPANEQVVQALMGRLKDDPAARLRWRQGGFPPIVYERDAALLAAHLLLDREEALSCLCPACRRVALGQACAACGEVLPREEWNESFDPARFLQLKEGTN